MPYWYQHLPEVIDPAAFVVGAVSIRWYALCYIAGILAAGAYWYRLTVFRQSPEYSQKERLLTPDEFWDAAAWMVVGVLVGSRLGYVLLYGMPYFWAHPWQIISPVDGTSGAWVGVSGMSFHGGFVGLAVALWLYCRRIRKPILPIADSVAIVAPLGIFLGRIGNFLNGELYGRVTTSLWGMVFPGTLPTGALRFPSQLIEALSEGVGLFVLLWWFGRRRTRPGGAVWVFVVGYALARFGAECFREPDLQVGFLWGGLTLGQYLSLIMAIIGTLGWYFFRRHGRVGK